ncbi:MAG: hypothetical protein MJE77_38670, partial [Proteobacteria bacterium]|nr:hypothetical protein [Pseudomonadota bacterium]
MKSDRDNPDVPVSTDDASLEDEPHRSVAQQDGTPEPGLIETDLRHASTMLAPHRPLKIGRATKMVPRREPHESDGKSNPALFTSGTLVGPHKLIRELGRGGMGAVYLAHDTR